MYTSSAVFGDVTFLTALIAVDFGVYHKKGPTKFAFASHMTNFLAIIASRLFSSAASELTVFSAVLTVISTSRTLAVAILTGSGDVAVPTTLVALGISIPSLTRSFSSLPLDGFYMEEYVPLGHSLAKCPSPLQL